ncbi:Lrp/AsnC family transcriptional regulator [Candidatus Micrarchaeota archaeon]|nr:Lrp/AsnC family transcriptional regulator [Candidatus Micrarchaeota archaeon]
MEHGIDEKDLAILEILKEHGDYTVRQIAKKTLLAPTTVHSRIKKLKKNGVIQRVTIDVDEKKLGLKLGAYVLIFADLKLLKEKHKSQYDLAEEIKKLAYVKKVDIVAGGADLIAQVRIKDIEEFDKLLLEKLQLLEGVSKTQTMIIMH